MFHLIWYVYFLYLIYEETEMSYMNLLLFFEDLLNKICWNVSRETFRYYEVIKHNLYRYIDRGGVDNEIPDIPMNATVTKRRNRYKQQ